MTPSRVRLVKLNAGRIDWKLAAWVPLLGMLLVACPSRPQSETESTSGPATPATTEPNQTPETRSPADAASSGIPLADNAEPVELQLGTAVEREIVTGQHHRYRVRLPSNSAARVVVRQLGADVSMTLVDAHNTVLRKIDHPLEGGGTETMTLVSDTPLEALIVLEPVNLYTVPQRYEIEHLSTTQRSQQDNLAVEAEQNYSQAIEMFGDGDSEVLELAFAKFDQAIDLWRKLGDTSSQGYALHLQASTLQRLGKLEEAEAKFRSTIEFQTEAGDAMGTAITSYYLGRFLSSTERPTEALEQLFKAQDLAQPLDNSKLGGLILNTIGSALDSLGRYDEAKTFYQRSVEIAERRGDHHSAANILNNLGVSTDKQGDSVEAIGYLRRVLAFHKDNKSSADFATALNNLASSLDKTGQKHEALQHYFVALDIFETVEHDYGQAVIHINLGRLLSSVGVADRALTHYREALEFAQAAPSKNLQAFALSNSGAVYRKLGQWPEARKALDQSLELRQELGEKRGLAFVLNAIGELDLAEGHLAQAASSLPQALAVWDELNDIRGQALTTRALGRLAEAQAEWAAARAHFQKALNLSRQTLDPEGEAAAFFGLARAARASGELEVALAHIERAVTELQSLRFNLGSEELKASLLESKASYYRFHMDVLLELHEQNPADGFDRRAFQIHETARARNLLDALGARIDDINEGVDEGLLASQQALLARLRSKQWLRVRAGRDPKDERLAGLDQEIESILEAVSQVRAEIRRTSPAYAQLTQPTSATVAQAQAWLQPNELLIELAFGETQANVFVLKADGFEVLRLGPIAEIEQLARSFIETVRQGNTFEAAQLVNSRGAALTEKLFAGLDLTRWRLLIVPDGVLHFVPFAALPVPSTAEGSTGESIVSTSQVVVLPSASVLGSLRERATVQRDSTRRGTGHSLAVIADPVFSPDDSRLESANRTPPPAALMRGATPLAATFENLGRLPNTRQEALAIGELAGRRLRFQALDFDANLSTLSTDQVRQASIIHLATHGIFDSARPHFSGLVFSLVDEQGRWQDGFLRMHDTFNLELNADLVVLSACDTALGEQLFGEGVVSLTRGFLYAGAGAVISSLWSVDDDATRHLMEAFYDGLLRKNLSPSEALRRAQNTLANQDATRSPYYWAAFQYIGP